MRHRVAALACMMFCAAAAAAEMPIACEHGLRPQKYQQALDFAGVLPIADYIEIMRACDTPTGHDPAPQEAPASAWMDSERELYRKVLSHGQADLVVVPFQVQGYGFDRIERALMSADLAYAIAATDKLHVVDPFLTARALGEGERRIAMQSADALTRQVGARYQLAGFVGHDKHHRMTLTLELYETENSGGIPARKIWQHDWRNLPFSDEQTPALVWHSMLPQVLQQLPLGLRNVTKRLPVQATPARIGQSPADLVTSGDGRTAAPQLLDLFGSLTASTDERSRERIFERAVIASWRSLGPHSESRFDEAYALMNLQRRPGALALLQGEASPAAVTLRALLQGDLPSAIASIGAVPGGLDQLLLQVSLRDLQIQYATEERTPLFPAATKLLGNGDPTWRALLAIREGDADPSAIADPIEIKDALDRTFPITGLDAVSTIRSTAVIGTQLPGTDTFDATNLRHVRQAATYLAAAGCCTTALLRPTRWDLLWLLEGHTEARLAKSLYKLLEIQGQPRVAFTTLQQNEPYFGGDPLLGAALAEAVNHLSQTSPPEVAKSLAAQGQAGARLAAYWAHGQSKLALRALTFVGGQDSEAKYLLDAYTYDYPRRAYWGDWYIGAVDHPEQRAVFAQEALAFSSSDVTPLRQLFVVMGPSGYGAVAASLGRRFSGNPQLPAPNVSTAQVKALNDDPVAGGLRERIAKEPNNWSNYGLLGDTLIQRHGDYAGAASAYLSYPGFHAPKPAHPVALANDAYEAGDTLWREGRWDLAAPLLKISADLQTGADSSLVSQQWLLTFAGNYVGAAQLARERADTYQEDSAYRDYLIMLHVLGDSSGAWAAFAQLKNNFAIGYVWTSALVGHERQGASTAQIRDWLLKPEIRSASAKGHDFASRYAVMWDVTDHLPSPDLGQFVEKLSSDFPGHIDSDGVSTLLPGKDENSLRLLRPSPFRSGKSPKLPMDTPIKSKVAYFADAIAVLRQGHFGDAVERFAALADRYPIDNSMDPDPQSYPLAYFAYAAAKSGDRLGLEAYIAQLKPAENFDVLLAKAFFASGRRDMPAAFAALESAIHYLPSGDDRPFLAEYQYAEACEWLYRDTGNAHFRDMLLDWARRNQHIRPFYAWPYDLEYAYSTDPVQRRRALAITDFLDPHAAHIQNASGSERTAARTWLRDHNPFTLNARKVGI